MAVYPSAYNKILSHLYNKSVISFCHTLFETIDEILVQCHITSCMTTNLFIFSLC
jgi:hypothetical protein